MNAFTRIVRRYQKPIVQFCYRMTGSQSDAEDIAQESFVRLYKALNRLRPDNPFPTVLFSIARNTALNHIRSTQRHYRRIKAYKENYPKRSTTQPDKNAQTSDIAVALETALETLSPEHKEVLVLREYHGFEYQHIAKILACPVGTVRSRLARAREQMRQHLMTYGKGAL